MIRIGVIAALAAMSAASVCAQVQTIEPAVPRALPEQRVEPAGEIPAPVTAPPRLVMNAERARRDADARHCLTLAANRDVHRCAERYRSRASRASAVRASAKRTAIAPKRVEIPRPADTIKPGPPRPDDAAKAAELVRPMDVTRPGAIPRPVDSTGTDAKLPAPVMKPADSKTAR